MSVSELLADADYWEQVTGGIERVVEATNLTHGDGVAKIFTFTCLPGRR